MLSELTTLFDLIVLIKLKTYRKQLCREGEKTEEACYDVHTKETKWKRVQWNICFRGGLLQVFCTALCGQQKCIEIDAYYLTIIKVFFPIKVEVTGAEIGAAKLTHSLNLEHMFR